MDSLFQDLFPFCNSYFRRLQPDSVGSQKRYQVDGIIQILTFWTTVYQR